jgi:hypothetical protein
MKAERLIVKISKIDKILILSGNILNKTNFKPLLVLEDIKIIDK